MTTLQCLPIAPEPVEAKDLPGTGVLRAGTRVLPLRAVEIDAVVVGLAATTHVRQRFANPADAPIEVTYVFPLPGRAAVTSFAATLGSRRITGVLKERAAAREAYDLAVASGQRAAIAEEDRPEVFSTRVGNLMPGEDAVVELELTGPVALEAGEATYRFPLVVAERYTAGTALPGEQSGLGRDHDTDAVPDASRVTPPRHGPADERPDLDIVVRLDAAGLSIANLRSTLHAATVEGTGGAIRLRLEAGQRLDRDLLVRWDVAGDRPEASALVVPDPSEPATGTWSLTIVPPASPDPASRSPRDVVLLLDRSGSMAGWKMVAARRAAARIVDSLDRDDRFLVLGFDHVIEHPGRQDALVPATDRNRFAAVSWLSGLQARGGTEMAAPLQQAAALLAASDECAASRRRALVLVTDGQISGEDHVLASVAPLLSQTQVFAVGVDRAVNAGFLDRLAGAGRGQWELVESEDRLDDVLARVTRLVTEPALTDLHVSGSGIQIESGSTAPRLAPDAYSGSPCALSGRYRLRPGSTPEQASLRVTARPTGAAGAPLDVSVTPRVEEVPAVRAIWARARVRDLEDIYAGGTGHMDELAAQIVATSLQFGVLSRFTAFVAVDEEQTGAEQMEPVAQPVENVSGWAPVAYSLAAPHPGAEALGRVASPSSAAPGAPSAVAPMAPRAAARPARMVRASASAPGSDSASRGWPPFPEAVSLPWLGSLLAALEAATRSADVDRLRTLTPHLAHAIRVIEPGAPGGAELAQVEQLIGRVLSGRSAASWAQLRQAVSAAKAATGAPDVAPLTATAPPATGPGRFWKR
ncbi:MAG: VIT domain-containing protein [Frankiaceae bacterium]